MDNQRLNRIKFALTLADQTEQFIISEGAIKQAADLASKYFDHNSVQIVADSNTFTAAGKKACDLFQAGGFEVKEPFIFNGENLHADFDNMLKIEKILKGSQVIPVAVGSGTINDIVKLASHRCGIPYMVIATAASMDGYTSFGASISYEGCKQTFLCAAPKVVLADMDILLEAPDQLNAAGYGDLAAKITAGADWILADLFGLDKIDPVVWPLIHDNLRGWLANPKGVRNRDPEAIASLFEGLTLTGFAMQYTKTSRPASGAEHLFSHTWDMQNHTYQGKVPFHGDKVAIGTLAETKLYEYVLSLDPGDIDIEKISSQWITREELKQHILQISPAESFVKVAMKECVAKYLDKAPLKQRLMTLKDNWKQVKNRLTDQLIGSRELSEMCSQAGGPTNPQQIGISTEKLKETYYIAQILRNRYTVLDLAWEMQKMDSFIRDLQW